MNVKNRKFTIAQLEIRKLITSDLLYILVFFLALVYYFSIPSYKPKDAEKVSAYIAFGASFLTIFCPFGLRFRNIYFSLIWLVLCTAHLVGAEAFAEVPILCFLAYHSVRLLFWKIYKREFIPYEVGEGSMTRYISFFEGRGGNKQDKTFTFILLILGISIMILSFFRLSQ
ncbi:hypothetical protein [Flavobacterium sp.]|uniref:hypothetical protein n=1 Tax=Flavobacterium sp. TaxID=239 RepID=UPI00263200C0|nr:hypothetical protein [Flavobacterium sp.]